MALQNDNAEFNSAAERAKNLPTRPSDDQLLKLYALFKQATVGDNNTAKPGMFDFKGSAKWNAWNGVKGMESGKAAQEYIQLVAQLEGQK